jgi:hypothetical protein
LFRRVFPEIVKLYNKGQAGFCTIATPLHDCQYIFSSAIFVKKSFI